MMHQSTARQTLASVPRSLRLDGVMTIVASRSGWLTVDSGLVWLTAQGGGPDQVLEAGQRLWLPRGSQWLAEAWRVGEPAHLAWLQSAPAGAAQPRRGEARVWRLAAAALAWGAGRLALAARSADAMARRAQGCISAGDSMASSGALQ